MRHLLCTALVLSLVLAGCQMGENQQAESNTKNGATVQKTERVPQTAKPQPKDQSPEATAKRLVKVATDVPNVNGATAIVFSKIAIVGIDVNAKLDRPRVGTIKYTVAEALKKDPQGANAIVTADPDIVQRIREINQDIKRGRPISGFAEELADIAGRIIPQLPRDVLEKKQQPTNPPAEK